VKKVCVNSFGSVAVCACVCVCVCVCVCKNCECGWLEHCATYYYLAGRYRLLEFGPFPIGF
jgi:hypothetical protein